MGAGYMSLDKGEMKWTLTYDEIDIVLEGELVITRGKSRCAAARATRSTSPKGRVSPLARRAAHALCMWSSPSTGMRNDDRYRE